MALNRGQSWLTFVTNDELVTSGIILAESLRRGRTTRRICAITCGNVSLKKRIALRKAFDHVFWLDSYYGDLRGFSKKGALDYVLKAKIFAFSIGIFEKCVLIGPETIVLENIDNVFEGKGERGIRDLSDGGSDSFYVFTPSMALFEFLEAASLGMNGLTLTDCVRQWGENNMREEDGSKLEIGKSTGTSFMEFDIESGRLLLNTGDCWGQPSVVTFVHSRKNFQQGIETKLEELWKNEDLGLTEKVIIETWLKCYENSGEILIGSPKPGSFFTASRNASEVYDNDPIAIVGMSCRLPGANSVEEFWRVLYGGEDSIREPPAFRWTKEHTVYGKTGKERETKAGFLSAPVDEFDAKFFGVSPKDAVLLDPQARILHEVLWESLENSGIDPLSLHGSHTGMFTGSWMNDYRDIIQASTERDFFRSYMGNSIGATAARLSFLLGLTGPCIATESGCSSAIVAVDLAVKSLRNGESNLAIAGGVNLVLHPFTSNIIDYVIAPDGRCKTFDAKADGFGRAEGCGVLVLKRLSDALRDKDNIWAMIRGSAVSQEGISRSLGTPTVHCEALAMELALKDGGIAPEQVSFVETHGTGTAVGDPMEVAAIAKAYHSRNRKEPLIIGSVKTNLGHTESVSGITGIIKTVLAMQHELIPKHLNLETINPQINLDKIPARIPLEPITWKRVEGERRLAGVSSFGITGTDGHVILEEAPEHTLPTFNVGLERPFHLIKFSAKTEQALNEMLQLYKEYFKSKQDNLDDPTIANTAYTANTGRATFGNRAFVIAKSYEDAANVLETNKALRNDQETESAGGKICFLFTGQGSQYPEMGKILYETSPVFRVYFDQCDSILRDTYNISIRSVLWHSKEKSEELSRTMYSQVSIFCVEYCLLRLWESWGLKPDVVLGHSLGEFVAAVAASILTFDDALKLVVVRSGLIDQLPQGSMLVIKANREQVERLMKMANSDLDLAAVNSNDQTVVAGDTNKIQELLSVCKKQEIKAIVLESSHAFHSRHMDPILDVYRTIAETVNYSKPVNCKYISGMEGKLLDTNSNVDANYWVRHTREKVSFLDSCKALKQLECDDCLEIGPNPVLSTFVLQNIDNLPISCYPSLRRKTNDWETILTSLGKLYLKGYKINWEGYDKPYLRKKVPTLPFYPFNRKSFWVDCRQANIPAIHPLIGHPIANASAQNIFQNDTHVKFIPYLKDHCIGNMIVFPGAAFTEMCMSSGYCVANSLTQMEKPRRPISLENVKIEAPLELKENKSCRFQTIVNLKETQDGTSTSGFECKVFHLNENEEMDTTGGSSSRNWVLHATALFHPFVSTTSLQKQWSPDRVTEIISSREPCTMDGFYKAVDSAGLKFGEQFRTLQRHWLIPQENGMDEIVAEMRCPEGHEKYLLHPLIIDTMIQTGLLSGFRTHSDNMGLQVPIGMGKLTLLNNIEDQQDSDILYLHAKWEDGDKCSVFASTKNLTPIALLEDIQVIETNVKTIQSVLEQQNSKIPDCWEEMWKPISGPHDDQVQPVEIEPILSQEDFIQRLKSIENEVTSKDEEHSRKINRLVYLYTLKGLFKLGWKPKNGDKITVTEFCEKYKITPNFAQLVNFYFRFLKDEHGLLEIKEEGQNDNIFWEVTSVSPSVWDEVKRESDILFGYLKQEEKVSVVVKIYQKVATHLPDILSGETSALSILFPAESSEKEELSAEMYYKCHPGRVEVTSKAIEITGTCWNKLRSMSENTKKVFRVLEVGAGTGSLSVSAVTRLAEIWGTQFEYYFTDISPSFFAKAEKKLEEFKKNVKFIAFNIEEPPLEQGIPVNYFDNVVASDVLHATKNLKECLQNLRQTLKPQGTIFFTDTLAQDRGITFVFGLLDGYWRFDDFDWRPNHTCVDGNTWRKLLLESGFIYVHVSEVYMGVMGCISAEGSGSKGYELTISDRSCSSNDTRKRWILFSPSEVNKEMERLTTAINSCGGNVMIILPTPEMDDDDEKLASGINAALSSDEIHGVIYAWGMDKTCDQKRIARPFMHIAQHLLNMKKAPKLYVLTRGVHAITENHVDLNPSAATLFGMCKSLKNESSDLFVRYVDLDSCTDFETATEQILFELAVNKETGEKERIQVAYRDGVRYEPKFNRSTLAQNPAREDLPLPSNTERYQLVLPKTKLINDLEYDILEEKPVGENEVEVVAKAYALNFRDIFTIIKPTKEFENLNSVGLDFAGVVVKTGEKVSPEEIKVGDRVFGANFKDTQLPSHILIDAKAVLHIPEKMTFSEAATLPAVFSTSFYCLINVAKMKKGDTVLIHTGSGGVGLSAIQIAKYIGANIITTAGNPRKRSFLRSLGIQHVFHSRNTSYQEEIMKVTKGRGVDIVLNSLTGPGFKEASLIVCAKNARFVEMSKLAVWTVEEVRERRPDVEYTIVDLTVLEQSTWKELLTSMKSHLNEGHTKPITFVQFDALRIRQALQFFQKAKHIGKVVVSMPEIKALGNQWQVNVQLFNSNSTYLITGGLGGIGFEVCKWMLAKGATDIVLIGRNPPKPEIAQEIERLNSSKPGYKVIVKLADVGDHDQFKAILEDIGANCDKPIRGIQHCAGVLHDNLYTNQTWDSFAVPYTPKIQGTWNIHHLTRHLNLEHFVLYSSITALVGTPAQANHSSANCFEDAFAHYRYSLGLPATTINWGQWSQVGCAKEVNVTGVLPVSVKRMLNGLEEVLRSQRLQVAFGEFESLSMWGMVCPSFKYYLDDKLLKSLKESGSQGVNQILLKTDQFWQEMDEAEGRPEKMEVVMIYMKAILRGALRMDADEPINNDANMKDLGVDSLMLIELKNSIQSLLGSRLTISANMLKDCNTIRELASCIVDKLYDENDLNTAASPLSPEELEELIKTDSILEETIRPSAPVSGDITQIKTVLVTGCTGQLGPYVISSLTKRCPPLEKIICLIRTKDGTSPHDKLSEILNSMNLSHAVNMDTVECLRGDVTKPDLGLEKNKYQELVESVDGVIHLAAKSNHIEPYREYEKGSGDIRSVNVKGTLNVLRFCSESKAKHVYYASSLLSVFGGNIDDGELCDNWPEVEDIKVQAENKITGYPISKYVCEMLLKQANARGIPCKIFRFPWIMGESETGQLNYLHNHYILRFLSYLKIKAMPHAPLPAIVLPVNVCADLSLKIFWNGEAPNEIYNIAHPNPQLEVEFVKVAKEDFDVDLELVEWESKEFAEKLYANGMPLESLKEIYEDVDRAINAAASDSFKAIQGYLVFPDSFFQNKKVKKYLPDFATSIPSTMDIIRKDLKYVRGQGFLEKFGL